MNFDTNFKLNLTESLRKNKGIFYAAILQQYKPEHKDWFKYSYYALGGLTEQTDISTIWEHFKACLDKEGYPELNKYYHYFYLPGEDVSEEKRMEVIAFIKNKSSELGKAFLDDPSMGELYNKLSNFNCFEDKIFDRSSKKGYWKRHYFNTTGWYDYYVRLLQVFLPEYEFRKTYSNKMVRFLRPVTDDYYIGFELNKSFYKSELKRYRLFSPEMKIILLHKDFDSTVNGEEYWILNDHEQLFVLDGEFRNPYFRGLQEILTFYSHLMGSTSFFDIVEEDGKTCIKYNNNLGEMFKRYAFFDFYNITYLIKPYFEYLEGAIKNMQHKVPDKSLIREQITALEKRNQFILAETKRVELQVAQWKGNKQLAKMVGKIEYAIASMKNEYEKNIEEIALLKKAL